MVTTSWFRTIRLNFKEWLISEMRWNPKHNVFLQFNDWSKSWFGEGRKIHCRTVFYKQVCEKLKEMGFDVTQDADSITHKSHGSPFDSYTVFRLRGVDIINERPDLVPPHFKCIQIIVEIPHRKDSINPKIGDVADVVESIKQRLMKY